MNQQIVLHLTKQNTIASNTIPVQYMFDFKYQMKMNEVKVKVPHIWSSHPGQMRPPGLLLAVGLQLKGQRKSIVISTPGPYSSHQTAVIKKRYINNKLRVLVLNEHNYTKTKSPLLSISQ